MRITLVFLFVCLCLTAVLGHQVGNHHSRHGQHHNSRHMQSRDGEGDVPVEEVDLECTTPA